MPAEHIHLSKPRVGICVATYKRRDLLRQLLVALAALRFERMLEPEIVVVVVDNDIERSAEEVCDSVELPWRAKYVVESKRGIAQARNRAIREAENPDFIVFIDDDEAPTPQWLDELLWTQGCFDGHVVCGPVLPRFADGVPDWVKSGNFFSKHVYMTGHPLETCCSGNVLISRKVMNAVHSFDERFALTGGEDTQFFLRARREGFKIICSGGAIVYEEVPASRASLRWLLRRAYQSGTSWVLCESSMDRRTTTRIARVAKACIRISQGAASACLSLVFGKAALVRSLSKMFLGVGMIAAMAGHDFRAYESAGAESPK